MSRSVSYRSPPSIAGCPLLPSCGVWFGNGARDSGLTLMGARVVGDRGIVASGWLAVVVGCGGRCGAVVGVAADVWMADVLTVAPETGAGAAVVGIAVDMAVDVVVDIVVDMVVDIAVDIVGDTGVASVGIIVCCAGWAGCSSTTTAAVVAAIVASTTPPRSIRLDHRFWLSGCASARGAVSSPSPADSTPSNGSNK